MVSKSLNKTLIIYISYAFLLSSILTIICLLIEYLPSTKSDLQKFGVGALILNSVLWVLVFTVASTTSILNTYNFIRENLIFSLLSFLLLPHIVFIVFLCFVQVPQDIFGFMEAAIIFLIV